MRGRPPGDEPEFLVTDYVTITRDPRTRLVVAIGGDDRAAGILQQSGGFIDAPGPRGPYHRQPHTMRTEDQCLGSTAAALSLLQAGYSVHLDPELNMLSTKDEDRKTAHRYLDQLADRARNATSGHEFAAVLTELVAPHDDVLHRLHNILVSALVTWADRVHGPGRDTDPAQQLINAARSLSRLTRQLEDIRALAARTPTTTPAPSTAQPPSPHPPAVGRHR
ncbi:hypothetical protein [Streptomyces neyagawaensis]|uniref:hypothetical protein n=1 Tax=Streptomyces neyagawaensis TaxID=42238 RepID=UPI0006E29B76|nr:hypothetical protein [Streptomyces neyagawaensis]MCL6737728.1 hypothetical protein [Streptomyces neyagawaensis]MDE1687719.1 hypothetical protein [Streptomyces neyagawaensis]MDG5808479.1 hypothetical protein [Streptomyces ossamyceticus]